MAGADMVAAVLRIAAASDVPVWPHSQGRNFGYGGAEPRIAGPIALLLRRMNRILDIDDEHGVAVVEPGVTFFRLHDALRVGPPYTDRTLPAHALVPAGVPRPSTTRWSRGSQLSAPAPALR